ncbi:MAG: nucleotide exchange factor GrpE, partial [Phycisphaerae bacterium]|nr:nucleotide exchange factor GrpE [Phycisphaerae bacterium]
MEPDNPRIPTTNDDASSINPEPSSSATDTQNPSASIADVASTDPAMLRRQLAAQKDDYLRLTADFDKFIKRTQRDSEQQAALEKEAFIHELLPILDNLERALASEQPDSCEPLHRGVTITLQEVGRLLQRHGIEPVEDVGLPFDPHRHEAVFVQHDPSQ